MELQFLMSGTFRGRLTAADVYIPSFASPVFSVTTTGALTATSADITGVIKATSGTFTGTINSGWNLTTQFGNNINGASNHSGIKIGNTGWNNAWVQRSNDTIYFNVQTQATGTGYKTSRIYVDDASALISFGDGAFSVDYNGALFANSATITGSISGSTITGSTLTLDGGGTNGLKIVGGYIQALYDEGVRIFNRLGTTETIIDGDVINTDNISSSSVETTDLIAVDISASKSSTTAEDPTILVSRSGSAPNSWFIGFSQFASGTTVGKVQYAAGNGSILYTTTSDKRLKTELNIQENILEKINSINLRYYHWNSDDDKNIFLGTYAQELHDIIPNAVSIGDYSNTFIENKEAKEKNIESSKAWGLDYSQVVPYLIGAIQQLSQKVDELESRMV